MNCGSILQIIYAAIALSIGGCSIWIRWSWKMDLDFRMKGWYLEFCLSGEVVDWS